MAMMMMVIMMMMMVVVMMMMMVVVLKRVLNAVRERDAEAIEGEALPIKEINLLHMMMMTAMTTKVLFIL